MIDITTNPEPRSLKAFSFFMFIKNFICFGYKFIKDEEFAKENKLGIWSMKFQYPWDFRKV